MNKFVAWAGSFHWYQSEQANFYPSIIMNIERTWIFLPTAFPISFHFVEMIYLFNSPSSGTPLAQVKVKVKVQGDFSAR